MRLLNTQTYALHEFFDKEVPVYAILSHRWSGDELTFQDYRKKRRLDALGHKKIIDACKFAHNDRSQPWLWIDTCCIDKKSSAELSEAINSMFNWYADAIECYVYLEDVGSPSWNGSKQLHEDFAKSAWFTRGWTLQELIAPDFVLFCNSSWQIIGHKTSFSIQDYRPSESSPDLVAELQRITTIPNGVLRDPYSYRDYSMAQRLQWASDRTTGRVEDEAYSLLGLLDVHMPLLYGERQGAFLRLQQEILKNTTDESILAWLDQSSRPSFAEEPLLASSPSYFRDSHSVSASEDLRIPRITIQSGLIRLDSSPIDECYLLDEGSDFPMYLVRLRCDYGGVDARPCLLMLVHRACGHYIRVDRPYDTALEPLQARRKLHNMTFYIHANTHHCYEGGVSHSYQPV